ncbi:MAG: hypothetical protein WBO32_11435 [Cyclobacteriaceae bacterium]
MTVFISPGTWILSGFGAGLFYLAGIEKPPMSYGMYFVVGILALFVYIILYSHWIIASTKLVLIEIVPSGLRIQQLKYDTLDEVIIEAAQLELEAITRYNRRNVRSRYELKISDKNETHSFSVLGDEELIGQMLEKIRDQKAVGLCTNENDFIIRYKKNINSVGTRIVNLMAYGVWASVAVGIVLTGNSAYRSYADGGYMSEWGKVFREYENQQPYADSNSDMNQSLAGFPKKWFPLFESYRGLVRQQICNIESTISLIDDDGNVVWKEEGPLNEWEGVVTDFVKVGERSYELTVQYGKTDYRKIEIVGIETDQRIYTIDGQKFTHEPDSFTVKNDTEKCL